MVREALITALALAAFVCGTFGTSLYLGADAFMEFFFL
jgi:hypothetical protein